MPSDPTPHLRSSNSANNLQKIADINQAFKERDVRAKAKKAGLKYIDLKTAPLNQEATQLMTWEEVEQAQAIPFDISGKALHVACVDPESPMCQQAIKNLEQKGYQVFKYICSSEGINFTKRYFENHVKQREIPIETATKEDESIANWKNVFEEYKEVFEKGTGPKMINKLNLISVRFRASDAHFQPDEKGVLVRMRRDGQLYDVFTLSHKQHLLLSGEIKRSAGMKANVTNIPQDGEYEFIANERKISVRVSTLPSKYGESLVLRILDVKNALVELNQLGFSDFNKNNIIKHLKKQKGLILVTGPTGSGKTSTLYSCLHYVNTPEKKIITLEDPIEFELVNIVQSEINEHEGYSFANGLRSILRQDPDVIMVGEIRDKEAAEIALQASLTGHLVLTTVHSNDAISTIPRLLNMGLKPYIMAAGMEMIIAQRLVRRICNNCKVPAKLAEGIQVEIKKAVEMLQKKGIKTTEQNIFDAKGCDQCANTGYNGRIAIAEVLSISDGIRRAMLAKQSVNEVIKIARKEGFLSLKEDGILKVIQGKTTIEEVWKVLV